MKRMGKYVGILLAAAIPILLIATYSVSCANAGRVLEWDEFSEGVLVHVSNCGGNSAAGSNCRMIALIALVAGGDTNDIIDFKNLPQEFQDQLASFHPQTWTGDAKYLLRAGSIHTGSGTHEIVVVCDTPFGNVPQPSFWNLHRRTMRHAAGYSDGTIGWLTPAEFAALDKTNFFELNFMPKPITNGVASFE